MIFLNMKKLFVFILPAIAFFACDTEDPVEPPVTYDPKNAQLLRRSFVLDKITC